jgi:hypothetical protein
MEKLSAVKDLLACATDEMLAQSPILAEAVVSSISIDKLITGALEEAFFEMVSIILTLLIIVYNKYFQNKNNLR